VVQFENAALAAEAAVDFMGFCGATKSRALSKQTRIEFVRKL
jgi:hypothetical protein